MLICEVAWVLLAYDNSRTLVDFVKESRDAPVRAPPSTIFKGVTEVTLVSCYRECCGESNAREERTRVDAVEVEGREDPSHSGRHLRVIGKRTPRDSPPSNIGVAHPRRELPRDSGHPDGSV